VRCPQVERCGDEVVWLVSARLGLDPLPKRDLPWHVVGADTAKGVVGLLGAGYGNFRFSILARLRTGFCPGKKLARHYLIPKNLT
jgi:hypothetical protein